MAMSAREDRATIDRPKIYRLANLRKEDAQRAAQLREMEKRAVELLKQSAPDTFLGRQLHDFIPLPQQQAQVPPLRLPSAYTRLMQRSSRD